MTDSTLWVAVFTGGTAVLASWVTSRGNARAARVQAELSAHAQHQGKVREVRRTAYVDLMEQAHMTGELYYRVGDVDVQTENPDDQRVRIEHLRDALRDAFDPLMRCVRVITLEGPGPVARAAEALSDAASVANNALWAVSRGEPGARDGFDAAYERFRVRLDDFITEARSSIEET